MQVLALAALLVAATSAGALKAAPPAVPFTVVSCVGPFCTAVPPNLTDAVLKHAAPGMVVGAYDSTSGPPLFLGAVGRHTYDDVSAVTSLASQYDMASCSKIIGATTATAILYQKGYFGLDDFVASPHLLGPAFASKGKGEIRIRNLLLHNAGFPPDPVPGYSSPTFPCPNGQNQQYHPGQNFACVANILDDLLYKQTIVTPPGAKFVYSDLSMITMMFVVATVVRNNNLVSEMVEPCLHASNLVCIYNAFLRSEVWGPLGMADTVFVPQNAELTPPEWNESNTFRHEWVKGYVSDQNAYALGGISGHAGVFTTVKDALRLMQMWMFDTNPDMVNKTTMTLFTTVANLTQSSRALGWDTNDQSYRWCGTMSDRTFLHIGFTGTEICGDPETGLVTAVLANGRHPDFNSRGMIWYRPYFNSLINDIYHGKPQKAQ